MIGTLRFWGMLTVCLLLGLTPYCWSEPTSPSSSQAGTADGKQIEIVVRSVKVHRFLGDRVELLANLEVTPGVAAVLEGVRFTGMRVDVSTPIYMETLKGQFDLQPGIPLVLSALKMSIYYSDFPSPSSMEAILDAQSLHVTGDVRADLKLSLLGKLAVRDLHPTAALRVDQEVPLDRDAVDTSTQLGVSVLSLAQKVLNTSVSVLDQVAGVRITSDDEIAGERMTRSMVVVRTTYNLRHTGGGVTTNTCVRLGFWLDPYRVLIPAEALEPWAYAVETAEALATGSATLEESVETTVFPAAAESDAHNIGWSQIRGDYVVLRQGHPERIRLVMPSGKALSLVERESKENFAILKFRQPSGVPFPRDATGAGTVRLLRRREGRGAALRSLEIGPQEDGDISGLTRPVDESAFGSPLLRGSGAIGMIVGERTLVPLPSVSTY